MEKKWFIGIDISKKTLDVVIYVPTKKHADETNYERFLNKEEGYKSLLCWLKKKNMAKKRLVISRENTGIYSFDLCLFSRSSIHRLLFFQSSSFKTFLRFGTWEK